MESFSVDTIICPSCEAELAAAAEVCDQCGSPTTSGMALNQASTDESRQRRLRDQPWLMTILLLHLGLFGIPLYWKSRYSRNVRIMIVVVSIVYTLFVVVVVVGVVGWLISVFKNAVL